MRRVTPTMRKALARLHHSARHEGLVHFSTATALLKRGLIELVAECVHTGGNSLPLDNVRLSVDGVAFCRERSL